MATTFDNTANTIHTNLSAAYSSGSGSMSVVSSAKMPAVPFRISVGSAIYRVTNINNNTLTISAALEGTTDVSLPINTDVWMYFTAGHYQDHSTAINNLQSNPVFAVGGTGGQLQFNNGNGGLGGGPITLNTSTNTYYSSFGTSIVSGQTTPVVGVPSWYSPFSANGNGTGTNIVIQDNSSCAFVAKGTYEADMILQHTGATSGQQCFYFRVRNGNFDIIVLNDTLNGINSYCYSTRYDGRMSMGFGSANTSTFPGILNVSSNSNAAISVVVAAASGQTYDLQVWTDSNLNILSGVDANGCMRTALTNGAPTTTPAKGSSMFDPATNKVWYYGNNGWKSITAT